MTPPTTSLTGQRSLTLIALASSVLALVFAVVFAVGPAIPDRTLHVWEPNPSAEEAAQKSLILVADTPEDVVVTVPCRTGRDDDEISIRTSLPGEGLEVLGANGSLAVLVANNEILEAHWPVASAGSGCSTVVSYASDAWTIGSAEGRPSETEPGEAPLVTELVADGTEALLESIRVEVLTQPHGSSPSPRQWLAGLASVTLAILTVLVILREHSGAALRKLWRPRLRRSRLYRFGAIDLIVILSILMWVVIGPVFFDDWWVVARHDAYGEVGRFTNYYMTNGVEMPFGYWLDWVQHWWFSIVRAPIFLRAIPASLTLVTWGVLRLAAIVIMPLASRRILVRATMASAFIAGAYAWLVTMRPEPAVALLLVVVVVAVTLFLRSSSLVFLAIGAASAGLALTAHPAGFVAMAPLIVAIPTVLRWMRSSPMRAVAFAGLVFSIGSITAILMFLDSDIGLKLGAAEAFRSDVHSLAPWDESTRYVLLSRSYGTMVRRLSVALGGLAVLMFVMRARLKHPTIRDIPGWSLLIAIALLSLTPSKWPWHFGTLVGLMAVAIAVEMAGLMAARSSGTLFRVAAVGSVAVVVWSWLGAVSWNSYDLVSLGWAEMPLAELPPWTWALLFVAVVLVVWLRRDRGGSRSPVSAVPTYLILVAFAVVASTSTVLIADAVVTDGWTFATQSVQTIAGRSSCGLADSSTLIANTETIRLEGVSGVESSSADDHALREGYVAGDSFADGWYYSGDRADDLAEQLDLKTFGSWPPPDGTSSDDFQGSFWSGWYAVPTDVTAVGLLVKGGGREGLALAVQAATLDGGRLIPREMIPIPLGSHTVGWEAIEIEIPVVADTIRILAMDSTTGWGGWIAVSEPFYSTGEPTALLPVLTTPGTVTFVPPNLGMYFPCITQPSIANGVAGVPSVVIDRLDPDEVFGPASDQSDYRRTNGQPIEVLVGESLMVSRTSSP